MKQCPYIWDYLAKNNMTQKELAEKAGIGHTTLNAFLKGRRESISYASQIKISRVIGKDPVFIFGGIKKRQNAYAYCKHCHYKILLEWIRKHCASLNNFANEVGISSGYAREIMMGRVSPTKNVIDSILNFTGMSYEECFKEV